MPPLSEDSRDAELGFRPVRHPHIFGMWAYRQGSTAYADLHVGALSFAQAGGPVCAVADLVDVKPDKVLAFLQEQGYVTDESGVCSEGVTAAIRHFGGAVLPAGAGAGAGADGFQYVCSAEDLCELQKHLAAGLPALLYLNDPEGLSAVVAVAGYNAAQEQVLLFDPRGAEHDGWYSWAWVAGRTQAFVPAQLPEDDRYTPRSIFKRIYGVDIAGHEQRWPDIDLDVLQRINPDCVGWIHLGGTPLSYPIVQGHLDETYYQTHNFSGEPSVHGAVSLNFANGGAFDGPNLVFSAHRMKDYSMFKMLTFYDRADFSAEKPCIDLILGTQRYQARVFSAYFFPKHSGVREPYRVRFTDSADFQAWVQQRAQLSMHPFPAPSGLEKVATFRTCYGMENDQTFVVHASLEKL